MFRELQGLSEDSAKFSRQRDRIVERCLPLADHIARRFDGRGETRDDLVQVARVGLMPALSSRDAPDEREHRVEDRDTEDHDRDQQRSEEEERVPREGPVGATADRDGRHRE